MFQEAVDGPALIDIWVVRVKAEVMLVLLDACVQSATVASEADRESEIILDRVTQKKSAFWLPTQKILCFVSVHLTPIETTKIIQNLSTEASNVSYKAIQFSNQNLFIHAEAKQNFATV